MHSVTVSYWAHKTKFLILLLTKSTHVAELYNNCRAVLKLAPLKLAPLIMSLKVPLI